MAKKKVSDKKNLHPLRSNKFASSPPAESTTLLQDHNPIFAGQMLAASKFIFDESKCKIDRLVTFLLFSYGLRIAEVLRIKATDINRQGMILINPAKGSDPRFVSTGPFQPWVAGNRLHIAYLLSTRLYDYYYRLFKKMGISAIPSGNQKQAVTHLFRYNFISMIQNMSNDIEVTGKIVGHKNTNNTQLYVKKSKK